MSDHKDRLNEQAAKLRSTAIRFDNMADRKPTGVLPHLPNEEDARRAASALRSIADSYANCARLSNHLNRAYDKGRVI